MSNKKESTLLTITNQKKEIKILLDKIYKMISLAHWEFHQPDDIISLRYLLRRKYMSSYCALIRSVPEGLKRCTESDAELIEQFNKNPYQPCWHYCHAGLIDFVFPIPHIKKSIPIIGGQILFNPIQTDKELKDLLLKVRDLPINQKKLIEYSKQVPVIPIQIIKSIIALITVFMETSPEKEVISMLSKIAGDSSADKHEKIQRIISCVKENYQTDFSLFELARKTFISPYYLSHLFKKEMGISIMQYKNYLRISSAKEMLKNSQLSITEIAFSLGYNDSNYFSLCFKKETGFSPKTFRKINSQ